MQPPGAPTPHAKKGQVLRDGLDILQRPEWTNLPVDTNARLTVALVCERIIVCHGSGTSTETSVKNHFQMLQQIIAGHIAPGKPFALIEEWSGLTGASLDARTSYIRKIRALERMSALIFCGVSPKFRMSIMLARRFRFVKFKILITNDLDSALQAALEALGLPTSPAQSRHPKRPPFPWTLSQEGFRMDCEVIEGDVFHTVSQGYLKAEHVDAITDLRQQIVDKLGLAHGFSGIIANVQELKGTSHKGRRKYTQSMIAWHRQYPIEMLVYYRANRLIRAGVILGRPFLPFKLRVVDSLPEAVDLIKKHRRHESVSKAPDTLERSTGDIARYARQLVEYLGTIQWEEDGIHAPYDIASDHPFADVFDAIALIKAELDDLSRERRLAETQKAQLFQQLQQIHKMESIGTLAGGISHDFNNILGIIQGNVDMALDEAGEDNRLSPCLEEIRIACQRGTEVVSQLLHFARDNDPVKRALNLCAIISESMNLLRATLPASIGFHIDLPENAIIIDALPTQIHQLMINMCTNAAHAMETTGGLLSVRLRKIEAGAARDLLPRHLSAQPLAELVIQDTGHGISPDVMDRIFDPYFTTKAVGKGTGLGLSVVHGIVTGHHGHITVTSPGEEGTRFTIWLPLSTAPESDPAPATDAPARGTEQILIVDDEIALVRLAAQLLGKLGYRVDAHTAAEAAMAAFEKSPDRYHLVITDMEMPGMTGTMLAERMKAIRPDIPIIMCTGFSQKFSEEEAAAKGFKGYLMKPLDRRELAQCVRRAIDEASVDGPQRIP
ncbi:MAG: response regulator [Pseudomonadota bacterium]